jgi:hypothetical protein
MKPTICFLILLISFVSPAQAQIESKQIPINVAFLNSTSALSWQQNDYELSSSTADYQKHCIRTYVGEGLMIGGGVLIVGSIIGIGSAQSATANDAGQQLLFLFVGVGGISLAIPGLANYISGKRYEHKHKEQLTVIGKRNQVGLAYNF